MSKRTRKEIDMINGPLFTSILRFSVPLMLTGTLQLLYNAADIIVVGRYGSDSSLAAVSSTGSVISLLVNLFMGLSVGASVVVSQNMGAQKHRDVSDAVHTSMLISLISGIIIGIFGFFASRWMLTLMDSPDNVIDLSTLYMKIYFLGMPFNMVYNFGASILRAVGETKRPLYYLSASGIVNVILNLIFVIVFNMDVAGVAIATVISQVISAVLVVRYMLMVDSPIKLELSKLKIHGDKLKKILVIGLPAGIQSSLFSISNVLIQSSINFFGSAVMAGNGAAANIEGFIYTVMNSISQATISFAGQNYGAGNYKRIKKVCFVCLGMVSGIGLIMGSLTHIFSSQLLSIYTDVPEEIAYGVVRIAIFAYTYFLLGCADILVGSLRGIGNSVTPTIVSIACICGLRLLWIYTVYAQYKAVHIDDPQACYIALLISYPISWLAACLCHTVSLIIHYKGLFKKKNTLIDN